MQSKRESRIVKTIQGELLRGEYRIAKVDCTFEYVQEFIPSELPDGSVELLGDYGIGSMQILEGGSDLGMIEDLVLEESSGKRWNVKVSMNQTGGRVSWEIQILGPA